MTDEWSTASSNGAHNTYMENSTVRDHYGHIKYARWSGEKEQHHASRSRLIHYSNRRKC